MTFDVHFSASAARFYARADAVLVRRLNRVLEQLHEDPFQAPDIRALHGKLRGEYRVRVGDWRVVFQIDQERRVVTVVLIAHRSSAYE